MFADFSRIVTCVVVLVVFILSIFILPSYIDENNILKQEVYKQSIIIKCYEEPNILNKDVCRKLIVKGIK